MCEVSILYPGVSVVMTPSLPVFVSFSVCLQFPRSSYWSQTLTYNVFLSSCCATLIEMFDMNVSTYQFPTPTNRKFLECFTLLICTTSHHRIQVDFSFLSSGNKGQNICHSGKYGTTCEPLYMDIRVSAGGGL